MQKDDSNFRDRADDSLPQTNTGDSQDSRRDFMKKVLARSAFAAGAVALVSLTGDTAFGYYADHTNYTDVAHSDIAHTDYIHGDCEQCVGWPHRDHMDTDLPIDMEHDDLAGWVDHGDVPHGDAPHGDIPHEDYTEHTDHDDHNDHADHSDHSDHGDC